MTHAEWTPAQWRIYVNGKVRALTARIDANPRLTADDRHCFNLDTWARLWWASKLEQSP